MNAGYSQEEIENAYKEEVKLKEQIKGIEDAAKRCMTKDALSRFGNLKVAHPEKALDVAIAIVNAANSGMNEKIDDKTLKEMLVQLNENRREAKIKWR